MQSLAESLGLLDIKEDFKEDPHAKYEGLSGVEFCRAVVDSPEFRRYVVTGILAHDIPPALVTRIVDHAWGKPTERVEHSGVNGAPIITRVERVVVRAPNVLDGQTLADAYDSRDTGNITH